MKINKCSICEKICVPGIDGRCEDCLADEKVTICIGCGQELSETEIKNGEDTCYPCQKGNR